jgi:hypothetical protein
MIWSCCTAETPGGGALFLRVRDSPGSRGPSAGRLGDHRKERKFPPSTGTKVPRARGPGCLNKAGRSGALGRGGGAAPHRARWLGHPWRSELSGAPRVTIVVTSSDPDRSLSTHRLGVSTDREEPRRLGAGRRDGASCVWDARLSPCHVLNVHPRHRPRALISRPQRPIRAAAPVPRVVTAARHNKEHRGGHGARGGRRHRAGHI